MFLWKKPLSHLCNNFRTYCNQQGTNILELLKQRTLLRVSGSEVSNFLQGLITNDIDHLQHGVGSMYTMFLNTKGRVLYDAMVYRTSSNDSFLIECDKEAISPLQKHLKMYRVRRKIDVANLDGEYNIFTIFNKTKLQQGGDKTSDNPKTIEGLIVPCSSLKESLPESSKTCKTYKDLLIYADPRLSHLGPRIIAPKQSSSEQQISEIFQIDPNSGHSYRWFRYNLGIGEGIDDLPIGDCFPLEANCDYLHGISFHKGCYIGQELTARTYHTGVVRKRLMPLIFSNTPTKLPNENKIMRENVTMGKLRGIEDNVGLAVMRVAQALESSEILIGNGKAISKRPNWWPLEAPKERTMTPSSETELPVKIEEENVDTKPSLPTAEEIVEIKYFHCTKCGLHEKYDYFGKKPPSTRNYLLEQDAYIIQDPFLPPKRGEFLVLGSHCVKCERAVCKDSQCSMYFGGSYCIECAKQQKNQFPSAVQEKLNRIVA